MDRAVGTGARAKLARAAADNAIWMPVTTCLLFAALKLAQGQPEEIASGLQVSLPLLSTFFMSGDCPFVVVTQLMLDCN